MPKLPKVFTSPLRDGVEVAGSEFGFRVSTHLRDEVEVRHQGRLQDNRDVARVEELDWVAALIALSLGVLDWKLYTEALSTRPRESGFEG